MRPTRRGAGDVSEAPGGGHLHEIVAGLGRLVNLPALERRHDRRAIVGAFAFLNGLLSIAVMSAAAYVTGEPFVFPSLGPTAFLIFYSPFSPSACPRNTIVGHAIGAAAGYGSLAAFGLLAVGPAVRVGVTPPRIGAAALSLAVTAGAMAMLRLPHPPAGATTLIVSLGILHTPVQLLVLMLGVVLITGQGIVINRIAGLDYPLWGPRTVPAVDIRGALQAGAGRDRRD